MSQARLELLLETVESRPHDPFPHYGLALEYRGLGRLEEAAAVFRKLLAAHHDYVPAYLQAGMLFIELGRTEEARAVLMQGVEVAARVGDGHARDELQATLDGLA